MYYTVIPAFGVVTLGQILGLNEIEENLYVIYILQWKLIITLWLGSMESVQSDRDIAKLHYKRRVLYDNI